MNLNLKLMEIINNNNNMMIMVPLINLFLTMIWLLPLGFFTTPLLMFLFLLSYSFIVAFNSNWFMNMNWYSYMIILMMVGGLFISFMYMLSAAPNELSPDYSLTNFTMTFFLLTLSIMLYLKASKNLLIFNNDEMNLISNSKFFLSKFMYIYPLSTISIFSVLYLFFCLIVTVKIVNYLKKPLKLT
nr:NADH dehydrogenase subunit 6 [Megaspilidae sp. ZJUH_2016022]